MSEPVVTVVLPTRNRAGFLRGAVDSVLAQTRGDWRLVVSDNASDDATPEVVAAVDDPRVESVRHPVDVGMVGNFNSALARVRTPFCALLLDDDLWDPRFLERTLPVLEQDERIGLVHSAFRVVDGQGAVLVPREDWHRRPVASRRQSGRDFIAEVLTSSNPVMVSASVLRTAALPPTLFDGRDRQVEDLGCWLRLALDHDVAWVDEVLASFRRHSGSTSVAAAIGVGDSTVPSYEQVALRREAADRFLDEQGARLGDVAGWRRRVAAKARDDALETTWWLAQEAGGVREVARLVRRAQRAVPGVARRPRAWRMLAGAAMPDGLVERLSPRPATAPSRTPTAR